jgi:site-specific DNA recombinase
MPSLRPDLWETLLMHTQQLQAAIYARVSSEQQAVAHTIDSQRVALTERVVADGYDLQPELQFIDEGYSGATLVRPALEQLRDLAAAGGIDRLYLRSLSGSPGLSSFACG